jgi:putative ABC transport system permease protein
MEAPFHDLRSAWRSLWRRRALSSVAVTLIALGIGMNTAVFAVLDALIFRKLAVPAPDRLVHFNGIAPGQPSAIPNAVPYGILERLRERTDLFTGVSGWSDTPSPVEVGRETSLALLVRVDSDFYRAVGARPLLGRALTSADNGPAAVVSYQFWKSRLGGDSRALGRTVRAGGKELTIVGVMPREFSGMDSNVPWDVAAPLEVFIDLRSPGGRERVSLDTVAALRPGVPLEAARREIEAMWPRLVAGTVPPGRSIDEWTASAGAAVRVESFSRGRFFWREPYRQPLELLLGMAGLVLLIVSSNVALVLLARGIAGRKEIAVRLALGASRARLLRQALFESLCLAAAGGALSLLVAHWSSALGAGFLPAGNVPFDYRISLDGGALAFGAALAIFTALVCGLVPALATMRAGVMEAIRGGGGLNPAGGKIRRALLVTQVALSVPLITASLLFAATLAGVAGLPPNFRAEGVLALIVQGRPGAQGGGGPAYFEELLRRLRALPGVERASFANQLPMQQAVYWPPPEEVSAPGGNKAKAAGHCVFPEYFATLGTPLLEGREFRAGDGRTAVIDEQLARRLFGPGAASGRTLRLTRDRQPVEWEVVGVVPSVKYAAPREPASPAYYLPCLADWPPEQAVSRGMAIAVRGAGEGLDRMVRRDVDAMGRQFVIKSAPLQDWVDQRMLRERMLAAISGLFGAVTLAVVGVGLYGLMAFLVASRKREIAIRVALGARRNDVRRLVARETALVLAVGVVLGLAGAAAAAKLVAGYLFGVRALDPAVLAAAALVLGLTAAAASLVPLRRALALEPAGILRHE